MVLSAEVSTGADVEVTYVEETVAESLEQLFRHELKTGDLQPTLKTYRNPQDDKIQLALQEAARRLQAEGKPIV